MRNSRATRLLKTWRKDALFRTVAGAGLSLGAGGAEMTTLSAVSSAAIYLIVLLITGSQIVKGAKRKAG